MLIQTIQLFIKALAIGIILNIGLAQVPRTETMTVNQVVAPTMQQAPLDTEVDMLTSTP